MIQREMRYALVDLANQTWDVKDVLADKFGTWGLFLQELRFWWQIDPTMVVLTTGILTGTGAPGTGAMTWCYLGSDGTVCTAAAEGRLGAYLRYAGVDAIVFLNKSEHPCSVTVDNGTLELKDPQTDKLSLLANRKNEDAVIVTVSPKVVAEDKYFAIAGKDLAICLLDKGVSEILVETTGTLPTADPAAMISTCTELWQAAISAGHTLSAGRLHPAYFLSLDHVADFQSASVYENPVASDEDAVFSALGIIKSRNLTQCDWKQYTAKLITAFSGETCTAEDIDMLAAYLLQLRQEKVGGDL